MELEEPIEPEELEEPQELLQLATRIHVILTTDEVNAHAANGICKNQRRLSSK